jgi:hypothetical protein
MGSILLVMFALVVVLVVGMYYACVRLGKELYGDSKS